MLANENWCNVFNVTKPVKKSLIVQLKAIRHFSAGGEQKVKMFAGGAESPSAPFTVPAFLYLRKRRQRATPQGAAQHSGCGIRTRGRYLSYSGSCARGRSPR